MSKMRPAEGGFTLVELLVTIAVAAVVTLSLNQIVTNYVHLNERGRYLNLANSFAEAKIETLRNQGFNALNTGTTSLTSQLTTQLPPSRSASMTVTSPTAGLKQVDLTVSYKDQGKIVSYTYTTYVGELGVGQ
ncbi:MAG TPA: prepilin-type N-terminal cleavage/methylation domain-containing protein [Candidatus Saccharimonadales bacterium]|nr:prepilin-type N-terminal cleavage/methylation domain-containing protein [Candidatus Saccharimonadales bacterium]